MSPSRRRMRRASRDALVVGKLILPRPAHSLARRRKKATGQLPPPIHRRSACRRGLGGDCGSIAREVVWPAGPPHESRMRLAIIGQQAFGKSVLEAFLARGTTVAGVFCAPEEKPGARPDPLRAAADERGLG